MKPLEPDNAVLREAHRAMNLLNMEENPQRRAKWVGRISEAVAGRVEKMVKSGDDSLAIRAMQVASRLLEMDGLICRARIQGRSEYGKGAVEALGKIEVGRMGSEASAGEGGITSDQWQVFEDHAAQVARRTVSDLLAAQAGG